MNDVRRRPPPLLLRDDQLTVSSTGPTLASWTLYLVRDAIFRREVRPGGGVNECVEPYFAQFSFFHLAAWRLSHWLEVTLSFPTNPLRTSESPPLLCPASYPSTIFAVFVEAVSSRRAISFAFRSASSSPAPQSRLGPRYLGSEGEGKGRHDLPDDLTTTDDGISKDEDANVDFRYDGVKGMSSEPGELPIVVMGGREGGSRAFTRTTSSLSMRSPVFLPRSFDALVYSLLQHLVRACAYPVKFGSGRENSRWRCGCFVRMRERRAKKESRNSDGDSDNEDDCSLRQRWRKAAPTSPSRRREGMAHSEKRAMLTLVGGRGRRGQRWRRGESKQILSLSQRRQQKGMMGKKRGTVARWVAKKGCVLETTTD
jgi:hypothetical protein